MTAELWLHKPCEHGSSFPHLTCFARHMHDSAFEYAVPDPFEQGCQCDGGSRVRLDPDKVVSFLEPGYGPPVLLSVQDIIDALEEK